jgi:hypothetical protein
MTDLTALGWDDDWDRVRRQQGDDALRPARVVAVHRGRVAVRDPNGEALLPVLGTEPALVGDWAGVRDGAVRALLGGARSWSATAPAMWPTPTSASPSPRSTRTSTCAARSASSRWPAPAASRRWSRSPRATSPRTRWPRRRAGEERQRVLEIRSGDDRGRHATKHRELFVLDDGALLVDTPGVRRPGMVSTEGLDETFADVEDVARGCRFADCRHEDEPACAVRAAIDAGELDADRVLSLRKLEREGLSAQERREQARDFHRRYRKEIRARSRPR